MGACRWKIIIPSLFGTQGLPSFSTCVLLKTVSMRSYLYASKYDIWVTVVEIFILRHWLLNVGPPIICVHLHDCASMQTNPVTCFCCRARGHSKRLGTGGQLENCVCWLTMNAVWTKRPESSGAFWPSHTMWSWLMTENRCLLKKTEGYRGGCNAKERLHHRASLWSANYRDDSMLWIMCCLKNQKKCFLFP